MNIKKVLILADILGVLRKYHTVWTLEGHAPQALPLVIS